MLCDDLDGGWEWGGGQTPERGDMCMLITDSHRYTAGTNTTL